MSEDIIYTFTFTKQQRTLFMRVIILLWLSLIISTVSLDAQRVVECDQTIMASDAKTGTIKFSSPTYRDMTIKKYIKNGETHFFLKLGHKAFIPQFGDNNVKILLENGEVITLNLVQEGVANYDSETKKSEHFFYLSKEQLEKLAEFKIIVIRVGVTEISAQLDKFQYFAACLLG